MENIRIRKQGRGCYTGKKYVEFYDVVADSKRFGKDTIMYQGDYSGCIEYIKRNGYDYVSEIVNNNNNRDIQIGYNMFKVIGKENNILFLKSRDNFQYVLNTEDLIPVDAEIFIIKNGGLKTEEYRKSREDWKRDNKYFGPINYAKGTKKVTVKFGNATTW